MKIIPKSEFLYLQKSINQLQSTQDKLFNDFCRHHGLENKLINDWMFDLCFNKKGIDKGCKESLKALGIEFK